MLVCISPAKKLDWSVVERRNLTQPDFAQEALRLVETARALSVEDLQKLMSISKDLASLTRDRFRYYATQPDAEALRPAALAFAASTYQGLESARFGDR